MYKVLLVDDEVMNYQLFEKLVPWEEKGFQIVGSAADGLEALQKYEELAPDLIFMDIQMPRMDGLECVRSIREADRKVSIVIVSAYGDFSYAQRAIRYGVQDFLLKPVSRLTLNQLVDKIKEQLDLDQAQNKVQETAASEPAAFYSKDRSRKPGGDNPEAISYFRQMPVSENLNRLLSEAIANNSPKLLTQYTEKLFEAAANANADPKELKEAAFDLLVRLKYTLNRLEREDTFSILRNVHPETPYGFRTADALLLWVQECLRQTFEEIDEKFFAPGRQLVLRTNALVDLKFNDSTFSLQEAADYNGLSKNYFTRQYKEQSGIGFWEYVTNVRIERAKELLISTDELVSIISGMVGYESEFHFSRKFKEYTGESPLLYRKNRKN